MKKIVIILGPTAVGKSDFGVNLAMKLDGEIISADSVQVYRGFDIGSAKIKSDEMQGIVHHCIDIKDPNDDFSVFDYIELTKTKIDEIIKRGKLPIIVGGTGLYIRALLGGYNFGGSGKQSEFRAKVEKENLQDLYRTLQEKDPKRAAEISPNDKKRIIRALEIVEFGEKVSQKQTEYDSFIINLNMDRQKLYERINKRVDIMLKNGLVSEVKGLLKEGVKDSSLPLKAIGYKEVVSYLNNEIDEKTMVELIKQHSRNYAKRQMTFFRSVENRKDYDVIDKNLAMQNIIKDIEEWL